MNKRIVRYMEEISKTEQKISELQSYLKGVKSALKQEEDAEIIKSIRGKKLKGKELLDFLKGIQEGNIQITSEEPEAEEDESSFFDGSDDEQTNGGKTYV